MSFEKREMTKNSLATFADSARDWKLLMAIV